MSRLDTQRYMDETGHRVAEQGVTVRLPVTIINALREDAYRLSVERGASISVGAVIRQLVLTAKAKGPAAGKR